MTREADVALQLAFSQGDLKGIDAALSREANPNLASEGTPLLHIAAAIGRPDIVESLLTSGADVDRRDAEGRTALMYAAWLGCSEDHSQIVDRLVIAGADVNAQARGGVRAIDMAARFLNRTMAEKLLAFGAECGAVTRQVIDALADRDRERHR